MEIKLQRLNLKNFMAVTDSMIEAGGKDITLSGRNGTTKTTHGHALSWLLTGKDLLGNAPGSAKFPIKTQDGDNNFIHNLDHEAEAVFEKDGKPVSLKKIYKEKWVKKGGAELPVLDGHTTIYHFDGVPVAEKDYLSRLGQIADEQTWRLLIDPLFFCQDGRDAKFTWKERRKILFDMFGAMTDEEIITATPALKELPAVLDSKSIDDKKAIIKSRKTAVKKELDDIPVRISEAQRNLPDLTGLKADCSINLANLRNELSVKQQELARIQAGGEAAEMRKKKAEAEAALIKARNEAGGEATKLIETKRQELSEIGGKGSEISADIKLAESALQANERQIERIDGVIENLEEQWNAIISERDCADRDIFVYEQSNNCPKCGYDLLQGDKEKAEQDFNLKKAQRIEAIDKKFADIDAEGAASAEEKERILERNADLKKKIESLQNDLAATRKEYAALQQEIASLQNQPPQESPEVVRIQNQIMDIGILMGDLLQSNQGAIDKAQGEIQTIQTDISNLETEEALIRAHKQTQERIAELKASEKKLAAEHESLEHQLWLLDEFTRVKCGLLEENINKHFKLTRWKLFREQVQRDRLTGEPVLEECCEAFGPSGAGFNGGMSQGEQKLVGIDCINQFHRHFGIIAPIILDGAESLTEPVGTEAQAIRLKAVEGVDRLTVEVE